MLNLCTHTHSLWVRLGVYDLGDDVGLEVAVADISSHSSYDPPRSYFDVAVATLEEEVAFGDLVRPVCLPLRQGRFLHFLKIVCTCDDGIWQPGLAGRERRQAGDADRLGQPGQELPGADQRNSKENQAAGLLARVKKCTVLGTSASRVLIDTLRLSNIRVLKRSRNS